MTAPASFELSEVVAGPSSEPILRDITLNIPCRGITAFAGPSGAGKSTLLRLLNRLDDPVAGHIRWEGRDLAEWDPRTLRRRVAMVFQRPPLFAGTVLDNLRVAVPDLDRKGAIAALEGGVGAVCTASGQAALHLAVATLASAGDHIVASKNIYGGSHNMMNLTLPRFGITTTFVDPRDPQAFADAIQPNTKVVFAETLGNPGIEVLDIEAVAEVAHAHHLPLMVDSTFSTPYLIRPIEYGADIVMHSATKFIGGHGVALGGVIVDGGRFDWLAAGKHPTLIEPYAGYHGLTFAEEYGPQALGMRARTEGLRDFGGAMSPVNAFQLLQGVETLPLRMARHVANTHAVVDMLAAHEAVSWVRHPHHASHPDHELAQRLYPKGAGAIVSFGVKGGRDAGRTFIESVQLASHLANVGDAKTLVIHPGSTTHQQLSADDMVAAGISEDLVRLSVGLEDPDDIVEDLSRALKASQR